MERKSDSSSFIICSFLLFMVLHTIPESLAARKLLDNFPSGTVEMPPPSPVNNVTYNYETRNRTHGQIVYVNGRPISQGGTIRDKDGHPVIQASNHTSGQGGKINGKNGQPRIQATNTTRGQSGIINGRDGKPKTEVHKYDNGTADVTFFGSDGKPIYHLTYQTPPGSDNGNSFNLPPAPAGFFTPQAP